VSVLEIAKAVVDVRTRTPLLRSRPPRSRNQLRGSSRESGYAHGEVKMRKPKEGAKRSRDIMFLRVESTTSCDSGCKVRQRPQHHELVSSLSHASGKIIITSTFSALVSFSSSAFPQTYHQPPRPRGTFLKQPRLATRFDTTCHQTAATTPSDALAGAV
jgi:hypothetical protein